MSELIPVESRLPSELEREASDAYRWPCPACRTKAGKLTMEYATISVRFSWLASYPANWFLCLKCGALIGVHGWRSFDGSIEAFAGRADAPEGVPRVLPYARVMAGPDPIRLRRCICRHLEGEHRVQADPPSQSPYAFEKRGCCTYDCSCAPFEWSGYVGPYPSVARWFDNHWPHGVNCSGRSVLDLFRKVAPWSDQWWHLVSGFDQSMTHRRLLARRRVVISALASMGHGGLIPRLP